jgi:hypothetical protein
MGTFPVLISTLVRVRVPTWTNFTGNRRQRENHQNGSDLETAAGLPLRELEHVKAGLHCMECRIESGNDD